MKKLLVLLFLILIPKLLSSQENSRLFSEAVQTNFSQFKSQSNQAYNEETRRETESRETEGIRERGLEREGLREKRKA